MRSAAETAVAGKIGGEVRWWRRGSDGGRGGGGRGGGGREGRWREGGGDGGVMG